MQACPRILSAKRTRPRSHERPVTNRLMCPPVPLVTRDFLIFLVRVVPRPTPPWCRLSRPSLADRTRTAQITTILTCLLNNNNSSSMHNRRPISQNRVLLGKRGPAQGTIEVGWCKSKHGLRAAKA